MAYVDKAYYNSFTLNYHINHSIHEDTMSSHVIAKLEAQLAAAKVEALEAQLKAARLEVEEVERKHPAKKARLVSPFTPNPLMSPCLSFQPTFVKRKSETFSV